MDNLINSKNAELKLRAKTSTFIIIYLLYIFTISFLSSDNNFWGNNKPVIQIIFYWIFVFSVSILNWPILKEINNSYLRLNSKIKLVGVLIAFLTIQIFNALFFSLFNFEYFSNDEAFIKRIIIIFFLLDIILMASIILFLFIYSKKITNLENKKIIDLILICVIINLFFISMYYVSCLRTWSTLFIIFSLTISNDTFGYLGGSRFDGHKIIKSVSPHKTWEGFFIGLISAILILSGEFLILYTFKNKYEYFGSLLGWQFLNKQNAHEIENIVNSNLWWIISLSFIVVFSFIALIGDLSFSKFKRNLKIKDFSNILPGQGGILDRIDSSTLTLILYSSISILINVIINSSMLHNSFVFYKFILQ